jgi:hypothetical protein
MFPNTCSYGNYLLDLVCGTRAHSLYSYALYMNIIQMKFMLQESSTYCILLRPYHRRSRPSCRTGGAEGYSRSCSTCTDRRTAARARNRGVLKQYNCHSVWDQNCYGAHTSDMKVVALLTSAFLPDFFMVSLGLATQGQINSCVGPGAIQMSKPRGWSKCWGNQNVEIPGANEMWGVPVIIKTLRPRGYSKFGGSGDNQNVETSGGNQNGGTPGQSKCGDPDR